MEKVTVVASQNVTEWEITKTEVENEMKIFITLTKYNTCQRRGEGNCCSLTKGYWMRNNQNGVWKWNRNLYNINKV